MDTVLASEVKFVPFPASALTPGSRTGPAVLVADDDPGIVGFLSDLLDDEGFRVHTAADGQEALERIARDPVDLVVADVTMPCLDGATLVTRLRERGDPTPVVLMSAIYADVDIPGVRFVPKPFDLDHILGVVNRMIGEEQRVAG